MTALNRGDELVKVGFSFKVADMNYEPTEGKILSRK